MHVKLACLSQAGKEINRKCLKQKSADVDICIYDGCPGREGETEILLRELNALGLSSVSLNAITKVEVAPLITCRGNKSYI
jgi:hypothetical protein